MKVAAGNESGVVKLQAANPEKWTLRSSKKDAQSSVIFGFLSKYLTYKRRCRGWRTSGQQKIRKPIDGAARFLLNENSFELWSPGRLSSFLVLQMLRNSLARPVGSRTDIHNAAPRPGRCRFSVTLLESNVGPP